MRRRLPGYSFAQPQNVFGALREQIRAVRRRQWVLRGIPSRPARPIHTPVACQISFVALTCDGGGVVRRLGGTR